MASSDRALTYRADIDGLRALAILSVLGYHGFHGAVPGGFVGVDVFFVISGYLITGIILGALHRGTFSLTAFYARRVRRIFPALVLVLAACSWVGWLTLLPNEYGQLAKHVAGGAGFIANFVLWRESGYFDTGAALKPLLHLWSLAIEEQFYLVWPLLIGLVWKLRLRFLSVVVPLFLGSLYLNLTTVGIDAAAAFYSPVTRFWELLMGGILAHAGLSRPGGLDAMLGRTEDAKRAPAPRELTASAGLLLILGSVFGLSAELPFPGYWAVLPTVGTCLLIAAGPDTWLARTILSNPGVVWVGLVSYPLYLWHWPLLSFARILEPEAQTHTTTLALLLVSGGLAWLTYRLAERPIRFGTHGAAAVPCLLLLMLALGCFGIVTSERRGREARALASAPQPMRKHAELDYDFTSDARRGACWLSKEDPGDAFSGDCTDRGTGPVVLLWGDSHAGRLYPGMRRAMGDRRLAQYTRDACLPILDHGYENCKSGNSFVADRIGHLKRPTVVLYASWSEYRLTWERGEEGYRRLDQTILEIERAGASHVVLVGPGPLWKYTLPRVLANLGRHDVSDDPPLRTRVGLEWKARQCDEALRASFGTRKGVTYVSAWSVFCDLEGCLTRVDDAPDGLTTWDHGHLTTRAAEYLARRLPAVP